MCALYINVVPFTPSGFSVSGQYDTQSNTTLTLRWDAPLGIGVGVIVDHYRVLITPQSLSHPLSNVFSYPPVNVTLNYNEEYTATITSVNCAGESSPEMLLRFEIGELYDDSYACPIYVSL